MILEGQEASLNFVAFPVTPPWHLRAFGESPSHSFSFQASWALVIDKTDDGFPLVIDVEICKMENLTKKKWYFDTSFS